MLFWNPYQILEQIQTLDPVQDTERICYLSSGYEFPWDVSRALELALLKTFSVPSVSKVLARTGQFTHHTQKRYDDTGLLIGEILKWGYNSDRGQQAIARMNFIHSHFKISNADYLYVLSTFIYEPIRWNQRFGWRLLSEQERLAYFYFWQEVGSRMQIQNIPGTFEELEAYNTHYEREYFQYAETNQRVSDATLNLFLSWFPSPLHPLLKPSLLALLDQNTAQALGWTQPSTFTQKSVINSLKLRGFLARVSPPRNQPEFFVDLPNRTYPHGYQIEALGMPSRVD